MRVRVLPYRVPAEERVRILDWVRFRGGVEESLGDYLRDWDPATDLVLGVKTIIDIDGFFDDSALPSDAPIRLFVGWRSRSTSIAGGELGPPIARGSSTRTVEATVRVPGRDVGGVLDLEAALVLEEQITTEPFVAHLGGSTLWRSERRLGLEGDETRFPVAVVDFESVPGLDGRAAWHLDWDPKDLTLPVLGGIQLRINARHPTVSAAVASDAQDPMAPLIRETLRYETARALIVGALGNPELKDGSEFEDGSVGRALLMLIKSVFGTRAIDELRARQNTNPSDIEAVLQAHLRLFMGQEQRQ